VAIKTLTVEAKGVGRKDYSSGIEFAVEPVIRSYQSAYSEWDYVTVPTGADLTVDLAIPTGYVAIVYDFFASFPSLTLLEMKVRAVSGGVVGEVVAKSGYGSVVAHLPKGFPFDEIVRFVLHNYADFDVDVDIGAVGIYTDLEHYLLKVG
jgi:hypothetical protein